MMRKHQIILIGTVFFGSIYFMVSQLDSGSSSSFMTKRTEDVSGLHSKLLYVEKQLEMNKRTMDEVRESMEALLKQGSIHDPKQREELQSLIKHAHQQLNEKPFIKSSQKELRTNGTSFCPRLPYDVESADINMVDVYKTLPFEDKEGGVWKQGFPIETSDAEWNGKKLKVFIVPHSHNDPGWIKTVEKYFLDQTQHILNNVVDALSQDTSRRFIWAEMSYLSMWWKIATPDRKIKMKQLVDNGQLEMVTAGWVMNDEANTHYFSMIDQMIEGNEWLSHNLGVTPKSGWAIDPFGHSSTMAYILKKMNFENMLIQRVHYAIKKHLAEKKLLEFRWRQAWSRDSNTDIICHMMPFYSYDVPHTCGPDPKICCQFDFARLPEQRKYNCPWKIPPVAISDSNVAERSAILLDQYRKKSKLYKSNTLLVILGDDFRYTSMGEALAQYENYAKIINYVNSQPDMNAELRFGTLSEYFQAMKDEIGGGTNLPSLTGDFFTYADREDHYWSGYYISRPFHKMQDRVLASHLRGAEILFTFALNLVKNLPTIKEKLANAAYPLLVEARQNLGLFQHHDGITGTAKEHVVIDYGNKLMKSVMDSKKVQALSAQLLILSHSSQIEPDVIMFDFDEIYHSQNEPPEESVILIPRDGSVVTFVVYNSLAFDRTGVLSIYTSTPYVAITLPDDEILPSQTNLIWKDENNCVEGKYQVQFLATVPPTGLTTFRIKLSKSNNLNQVSSTTVFNVKDMSNPPQSPGDPFEVHAVESTLPLLLENDVMVAQFSPSTGLLQSIKHKSSGLTTTTKLEFVTYSSRNAKDKSGAYLFLPSGHANPHVSANFRPLFRLVMGQLSSEIQVHFPNLLHRAIVYRRGDGTQPLGVHVRNDVDVRSGYDNKEIAMRITSDVQSSDKFYTDLNGFQIQQRTNYDKLPLQANFYPMPSMAFIQDRYKRLSLFSGQPLGVSSLKEGQLEVIMDRRLMQDDNRGLGQGVRDNVMTPESFVILLEHWKPDKSKESSSLSYPSLAAHRMSWELLHPFRTMTLKSDFNKQSKSVLTEFDSFPSRSWPCDIHLLNLRSIQSRDRVEPTDQSALILHRIGRECGLDSDQLFNLHCQDNDENANYDFTIKSLYHLRSIRATSLSLQQDGDKLDADSSLTIKPMEIEAFKVTLS